MKLARFGWWAAAMGASIAACGSLEHSPPPKTTQLPAQVLNLRHWKLTLPIGEPGNPTEIQQPALATYSHPDFFEVTPDGTGVIFTAPCGGVTTKGSNYPRSELREMTPNYQRAAWATDDGRHVMRLKEAITHLPAVKPQVVAGQIHDDKSDLITIRLDKHLLFIDHGGMHGPTLTDKYELGNVFTVEVVAEAGRVKVSYNGTPSDDYPAKAIGCYFKTGCYTQSNVTKGDKAEDFGRVVVYSVEID